MKFACYTLGCKVNQYETQAMEQLLVQSGHTLGSFDEICDGYIINTCTVTAVSDKKSRNAIRRVRKLNPQARGRCVRLLCAEQPGRDPKA